MTWVKYQPEKTVLGAVPMFRWGKDHWSTLCYLETIAVDNKGLVKIPEMRTNVAVHPEYVHHITDKEYPTRLRDGFELPNHDDWSCMEDMICVGLMIAEMEARKVRITLTEFGWCIAGALRRYRGMGGTLAKFSETLIGGQHAEGTDSN